MQWLLILYRRENPADASLFIKITAAKLEDLIKATTDWLVAETISREGHNVTRPFPGDGYDEVVLFYRGEITDLRKDRFLNTVWRNAQKRVDEIWRTRELGAEIALSPRELDTARQDYRRLYHLFGGVDPDA